MTTFDSKRLMTLLPAVYRLRDAEQVGNAERGGPLAGLLEIIGAEVGVIEQDIAQLYDDHFIETCADWVVPYLGDLVGYRPIAPSGEVHRLQSSRAEVANTIAYRRRKGTAAILELLARDVTGWPARLVEYFLLLSTTQRLNHLRPQVAVPDLRRMTAIERIATPFDQVPHSLDVRRVESGRGRYNIPSLGLILWRLGTSDVEAALPRPHASGPTTRFHFNPLGLDAPLFNPPRLEDDPLGFATDVNFPDALTRRALARELNARRAALVNGDDVVQHFFGVDAPFAISLAGARIPDDQILICDLSGWAAPPATRAYLRRSDGVLVPRAISVAVDPMLGRFRFGAAVDPDELRVSYTYAFPADLGGGPYDRTTSIASWLDPVDRPVTWQVGVSHDPAVVATSNPPNSIVLDSLADAVNVWKAHVAANPGAFGVIAVMDSSTYAEALTGTDRIEVPAGSRLAIVAAQWPRSDQGGPPVRPPGALAPTGLRPHLNGTISIVGTTAPDEVLSDGTTRRRTPGDLILDGLLLEGDLRVLVGALGRLELRHTTLVPDSGTLQINSSVQPEQQNSTLTLLLDHAIVGQVTAAASVPTVSIADSIVDGAMTLPGSALAVRTTTILGTVATLSLEASDTIFAEPVTAARRQTGCVRFSHVPDGSRTPRRFRCQPDLAVEQLADPTLAAVTRRRVAPVFTSFRYGDAAYVQLSDRCADEIRTGASDGSEMGGYSLLHQPQREAGLRLRLREHLRVGLEAGLFSGPDGSGRQRMVP